MPITVTLVGGTVVSPPPPPPPPPATSVRFGAASDMSSGWAAYISAEGQPYSARIFTSGNIPSAWSSAGNAGLPKCGDCDAANIPCTVFSFHPVPSTFASGSQDAAFLAFLATIPTITVSGVTRIVYITIYHEPESKIKGGTFTLTDWQAAIARMGQLIHSTGRTDLKSCIIFQGNYTFKSGTGANVTGAFGAVEQYWGATFATDVDAIFFDNYYYCTPDKSTIKYEYAIDSPTLLATLAPQESWARYHNKPFGSTEWAINDNTADLTLKPAVMQAMYDHYAAATDTIACIYFDSTGTHYNLDNTFLLRAPSSVQGQTKWAALQAASAP